MIKKLKQVTINILNLCNMKTIIQVIGFMNLKYLVLAALHSAGLLILSYRSG